MTEGVDRRNASILLKSGREGWVTPAQPCVRTKSLPAFAGDVQAHFERAKAAGAKIVEEPQETVHGKRISRPE